MRRGRSLLRKTCFVVAGLCLLAILAALVGAVVPRPMFLASSGEHEENTRRILLLYNPIHTDIAFPAEPDVLERYEFLAEAGLPIEHPDVAWIIVGWGGRSFYLETPTWADLKPAPVFKALTVDSSVMHVALAGEIDTRQSNVDELIVPETKFDVMLNRALATFASDSDGIPRLIEGASYGGFDRFYEATGLFNVVVGCNTWTADVLRVGGARTGLWNPLPFSLRWSLKLFGTCPSPEGPCRI